MRMTHSAYIEYTYAEPREGGSATSGEFPSEEAAREWADRTADDLRSVALTVTRVEVNAMPAPETVKFAMQDGRYFFSAGPDEFGRVLFTVDETVVRHDFDTAGAQLARVLFLQEFPNATFPTDEEMMAMTAAEEGR